MSAISSSSPQNSLKIMERIYDNSVSYERKSFDYQEDGVTYSTTPNMPQEPHPQKALQVPNKELKGIQEEMVLKRVHPGKDGRKIVNETHVFPKSIHVQIEMIFPDGNYGGSGVLVGPHHVLTCAHNVYNFEKKHWASQIDVYPARNRRSAPFGRSSVTRTYVFENWTNEKDRGFDIALLVLNQSVGLMAGWGGLFSGGDRDLINRMVYITGYPGDKDFDEMWEMGHRIEKVYSEVFEYEIDTAPGQSGSAIWSIDNGLPIIFGVHTLGSNQTNSGVRISRQKFTELFVRYVSDTYKIKNKGVNMAIPENDVGALRALLTCPISYEMFKDPVTEGEGTCKHTFERKHIIAWLNENNTCPISRKPLKLDQLVENLSLKYACNLLDPNRIDPIEDEDFEDIHDAVRNFIRTRPKENSQVSEDTHQSVNKKVAKKKSSCGESYYSCC